MTEMSSNEIQRLREEFANEIRSLKAQVENLQKNINRLSQSPQTNQPASLQDQLAQEIMAQPANPGQEVPTRYPGR